MKSLACNLKVPFIAWLTSPKTEGVFCSEVKKNGSLAVYQPRSLNGGKMQKLTTLFFVLKNKNCKGILVDNSGGSKTLLIIILSKLFDVPIFMRLGGGMSGEFFDKLDIKNPCARYLKALWEKFKRRLLLYASKKIFPVSIFAKSQVLYELPEIDLNRLKVLYRPVDFEVIDCAEKRRFRKILSIKDNTKILLSVTGFRYKRKYEALIYYHHVIVNMLEENPDWSYVIAGAGAGLQTFKKEITQKTPINILNRIFIIGHYQKIYEAFADAELFVYMSYRDAGPRAIREAQASSLPVIANYSCFGSNEFIPHNYDGVDLLFEEPEELATLLEKLLKDEKFRKDLGAFNRKIAEEKYNPKNIAIEFLKEIEAIDPGEKSRGGTGE